jgi:hypothetical protein
MAPLLEHHVASGHHLQLYFGLLLDWLPWFLTEGKTCCYIHHTLLLGFPTGRPFTSLIIHTITAPSVSTRLQWLMITCMISRALFPKLIMRCHMSRCHVYDVKVRIVNQVCWPGNHICCALPENFYAYGMTKIPTDTLGTHSKAEAWLGKASVTWVKLSSTYQVRVRGLELE